MKNFYRGIVGCGLAVFTLFSAPAVYAGGGKEPASGIAPGTGSAGTGGASGAEQAVKIRFAIQPGSVQPQVADRLGYFKEEGLDVEFSIFSYGPPIIEAFTSKNVDFGLVGDLPVFSGIANGVDVQIVATASSSETYNGLIVRDAAKISKLSDLKGKKVSVPFGSNSQPLLYLYLERGGLKDTDLEIINLSVIDSVTSIVAGRIDAAVVWEPNLSVATQSGNGVSLFATAAGFKLFVNPVIARGEFVSKYPEQAAKFLRSLHRAGRWAKEHPDEAAQFVFDATQVDPAATKNSIAAMDYRATLSPERIEALVKSAEQSYQYGLITEKIDVLSHIDPSFLKAAGIQ
jgi:aliphatic sulfonates family ABC transporter substrate-binding protein